MKKLLFGAIALSTFSISLLLFQISCQKEVTAAPTQTTQQQNKILIGITSTTNGAIRTLLITDYDGGNQTKVSIPAELQSLAMENIFVSISPDGQTIFISGRYTDNNLNGITAIYSMTASGTNLKKIVDASSAVEDYSAVSSIQAY